MTQSESAILRTARSLLLAGVLVGFGCLIAGFYGDLRLMKMLLIIAAIFALVGVMVNVWNHRSTKA